MLGFGCLTNWTRFGSRGASCAGEAGESPALTRSGDVAHGHQPECLRRMHPKSPLISPPRYAEEGQRMTLSTLHASASRPALASKTTLRPRAVALTAVALVASALLASPAQAQPASDDRLAGRTAAGWLNRQFVDGTRLQATFDGTAYDDAGLTLDAVLAFAAAKTNAVRSDAAMNWVSQPATLAGYIGSGTESYAGAHAKVALALQVTNRNPRAVAGRDVIAELAALQQDSGRLSDASQWGDFSNAFGQSFGAIALKRAGLAVPAAKASGYLQAQACADGSVPISFEMPTCAGDADATGVIVQTNLGRAPLSDAALRAMREVGSGYSNLDVQQAAELGAGHGQFGLALMSAGQDDVHCALDLGQARIACIGPVTADTARELIRANQQGCATAFTRRAAIAYTLPYDASAAPRATAQAILGLAGANLATLRSSGSIAHAPTVAC